MHHSKGKTIKIYELNANFDHYEFSRVKWVLDWGSPLFMMTKYLFFLSKTYLYFFTARGKMEFSYRIRSLLTLVITHKSIFLLCLYLFPYLQIRMYGAKRFYCPYIVSYIDSTLTLFHTAARRLHDRMLWASSAGHNILWRQHLTGNT